jgi:hypothetical protein
MAKFKCCLEAVVEADDSDQASDMFVRYWGLAKLGLPTSIEAVKKFEQGEYPIQQDSDGRLYIQYGDTYREYELPQATKGVKKKAIKKAAKKKTKKQ